MADDIIRVRATQPGVYGNFRETGDEFNITDPKHFSKRWMEKVVIEKPSKKNSDKE